MATVRSTMLAIMLVAALAQSATAKTYTVGDDLGWTIPDTSKPTFYDDWAADKTFMVGDVLIFKYTTGHNVYQVSGADAKDCVSTNALAMYTSANPNVKLTEPGEVSYICEVAGHCLFGMKMTLTVAGNATLPPSTIAPSTSPNVVPPTPSSASGVQSTAAMIVGSLLVVCASLVW